MRLRSLRSLPNVAFMSHGEAGESSRSQPGGGALVDARLGQARVPVGLGGGRRDLDAAAGRREAVGELDARLGVEAHRAGTRELVPATPEGASRRSISASSLSCSAASAKPIAAARRRKISALRSASPGGSAALTWADSVWWKYDATMSSHSRNPAAGST